MEGGFDGTGAGFAAEGGEAGAGKGGPLVERVSVDDEDAEAIGGPCGAGADARGGGEEVAVFPVVEADHAVPAGGEEEEAVGAEGGGEDIAGGAGGPAAGAEAGGGVAEDDFVLTDDGEDWPERVPCERVDGAGHAGAPEPLAGEGVEELGGALGAGGGEGFAIWREDDF